MQRAEATPRTAPTRHFLLEAMLVIATVGLYLGIWFYLAARDFRRVAGQPATPFLWIFVPFFAFLQPFAFPRFFSALRDAQKRVECPRWPLILDYIWMAVFFGLTLTLNIAAVATFDVLTQLAVIAGVVIWFIPLHMRVNRLRRRCDNEPVMPRKAGFNVPEWFAVILFTPLLSVVFGILLRAEIQLALSYDDTPHTAAKQDVFPFILPLSQTGWKQVATGTVTEDPSAFEAVGPLENMWYAVFIYDSEASMEKLSSTRHDEFLSALTDPECNSTRTYIDNTDQVKFWTLCEAMRDGTAVVYLSSQWGGKGSQSIELVGYFKAEPAIMKEYRKGFVEDAKGFRPKG